MWPTTPRPSTISSSPSISLDSFPTTTITLSPIHMPFNLNFGSQLNTFFQSMPPNHPHHNNFTPMIIILHHHKPHSPPPNSQIIIHLIPTKQPFLHNFFFYNFLSHDPRSILSPANGLINLIHLLSFYYFRKKKEFCKKINVWNYFS